MISRDRINPVVYNWNATKLIKSSGIQFLGLKFLGESFSIRMEDNEGIQSIERSRKPDGDLIGYIHIHICSSISLSGRHFFRQVFLYFNLIDGNGHDV